MSSEKQKRSKFSSRLGFVLSAAGSAVGLGNIWRFPYLAAKYGGGIFLLVYLLLMLTFGYTMIIAESAIGRMTRKSPVGAYARFGKDWMFKAGGWINAIIPILIVPYYSVIGGWVCKYLFGYIQGETEAMATAEYFTEFIGNGVKTEFWFLIFTLLVLWVIFMGVENGIEKVSTFMMPILVILAILLSIYAITRKGAFAGVKYFLVPNIKNFSWMTVVSAMGQMFYSLSIAMGILITFGSYMKSDLSIEESTSHVEVFDRTDDYSRGFRLFQWRPLRIKGRPFSYVYYYAENLCQHGLWSSSGDSLFCLSFLCGTDFRYRFGGKCGFHLPG